MFGSLLHCVRSCCENDERRRQREIDSSQLYDPPHPAARDEGNSGLEVRRPNDQSENNNACCRPESNSNSSSSNNNNTNNDESRRRRVFWFWRRLAKVYEEVQQQDTDTITFKETPPASPLQTADSFDGSHGVPAIGAEQVVLPGSVLQKEMDLQMAKTLQKEEALGDTNDDECVICMETFSPENPRMPTMCGCGENKTYFHLPCLYQWIEQSNHCPSCRQELLWEEF